MRFLLCTFAALLALTSTAWALPGNPPLVNPWLNKANLWYDPQNSSTHANDNNDCTTQTTPCLTAKRIRYRFGGLAPQLNQSSVVVNVLSSNQGLGDPLTFQPCPSNGNLFAIEGVLQQVGSSCTITAVTAKNVVNTAAVSTLHATATCITSAGQFIINATHPSRAFARSNISGNNWVITQPTTQCDAATNVCGRTEVNTWAVNDTITVWTMPTVDIDNLQTTCGEQSGYVGITHVAINGSLFMSGPVPVIWEDEILGGNITVEGSYPELENFYQKGGNVTVKTNFSTSNQVQFFGLVPGVGAGLIQAGAVIEGANFGLGLFIGPNAVISGNIGEYDTTTSDVYVESGLPFIEKPSFFPGGAIFGPGTFEEMNGGFVHYISGSPATTFLNGTVAAGGLGYPIQFGTFGNGTGCATNISAGAGAATNCSISMTPNVFDAVFSTGCAGSCWWPGGFLVSGQ